MLEAYAVSQRPFENSPSKIAFRNSFKSVTRMNGNMLVLSQVAVFFNPIVVGLFDSTILVGGGAKKPPLSNSLLVIDRATKFGVLKASGMYFLKI